MFKQIISLLLAFLLLSQPVFALSKPDGADWKFIKSTIGTQAWHDLKDGVVTIPETAINDYAALHLPAYPSLRSAHISIHSNNRLTIDLDTHTLGHIRINGTITRFVQSREESTMSIRITKRKLLDKPVTSWFLAQLSLGMLTKLFGNPMNDGQHLFATQISGDTVTVNFKPFMEQSALNGLSIGNVSVLDLITVESLSTVEGAVLLQADCHTPPYAAALLRGLAEKTPL